MDVLAKVEENALGGKSVGSKLIIISIRIK